MLVQHFGYWLMLAGQGVFSNGVYRFCGGTLVGARVSRPLPRPRDACPGFCACTCMRFTSLTYQAVVTCNLWCLTLSCTFGHGAKPAIVRLCRAASLDQLPVAGVTELKLSYAAWLGVRG